MASPQKRVQLKGSTRSVLPAGQHAGPADPNQQIEVTVLLRRGSSSSEFPSLAELSARLPGERKYLSREEFARLHGASEADLEKVRMFAKEHNLKVVRENRGSRVVKLSGTVQ